MCRPVVATVSALCWPVCIGVVLFSLPLLAGSSSENQGLTTNKVITVEPQSQSDAVLITNVSVEALDVQCGLVIGPGKLQQVLPFQAGGDWLQKMTISLLNRTDQTIVAGELQLIFLDTGDGRGLPHRAEVINFGQLPPVDAISGKTGKPSRTPFSKTTIEWKPGKTFVLHVGDYMDDLRAQVEDLMPLTSINRVFIVNAGYFFPSGMRWNSGGFAVPDEERPGKFKSLYPNFFPGNKSTNWPIARE
jgi:hypothetical protein